MYSILGLGTIMLLDAFGAEVPSWVSPLLTFGMIAWFLAKSVRQRDATVQKRAST